MKRLRFTLSYLTIGLFAASILHADTVATEPIGVVGVTITAGTGTVKRSTLLSLPLLDNAEIDGQTTGRITALTATTITNANAGWIPKALSKPATPKVIQITSGAAQGQTFLIASCASTGGALAGTPNTATTVTISSVDSARVNLTTLGIQTGINGDTYRIHSADTLDSFFGTPSESGILGGTSATTADTIQLAVNGTLSTYFYSTTLGAWTRLALNSPSASNVALVPNYGMQYERLAGTALSFAVSGAVPVVQRQVSLKNSGTTYLAQSWPTRTTLAGLGLNVLPGWQSGATTSVADLVYLTSGSSLNTYFYDGTNWRRSALGNPISNTVVIPAGTTISIQKKGSLSGYSVLTQALPYDL